MQVRVYEAHEMSNGEWRDLQAIQKDAFAAAMPERPVDEIEALVGWEDAWRFAVSHGNPNSEVGGLFNEGQSYSDPKIAIASEAGSPVGWAYAANNVSGSNALARLGKMTAGLDYFWLREVAVNPGHWREGIAKAMGGRLLQHARPGQRLTAYTWPDELPVVDDALQRLGFRATGEQRVRIFGDNSAEVRQVRMQAASVRSVLGRLAA